MFVLSDPVPSSLSCPSCHASRLRPCGELLFGRPYQQILVACLACERVFTYTKLTPGVPLIETPLVH
jgi:hypothetical protein